MKPKILLLSASICAILAIAIFYIIAHRPTNAPPTPPNQEAVTVLTHTGTFILANGTYTTHSKTGDPISHTTYYVPYFSDTLPEGAPTKTANAPTITQQPTGVTVNQGSAFTLTVTASEANLTYQWKKNGTNITNATSTSYMKSPVTTNDAGSYTVTITNTAGSVTSTPANVTVNVTPSDSNNESSDSSREGNSKAP
jgi:hypothetical protein